MKTATKRDLVIKISNETGMTQQQVFDVIQKNIRYDHTNTRCRRLSGIKKFWFIPSKRNKTKNRPKPK